MSSLLLLTISLLFGNSRSDIRSAVPEYSPLSCDTIPPLNAAILSFVTDHLNKRVGRGECWDLADQALRAAGARWDGRYKFGEPVHPETECIFAGDIIQFEGVKTMHKEGTRTEVQEFQHHTAVIYEVKDKGRYILAHQNTAFSGRKVGLSELHLGHIVKGRYKIYRPAR